MEDYDTFVQHRLSHLRSSDGEEDNKARPASSLIRFYGRSILPPLLSEEEREEMQRHRDAAQKAAAHRRSRSEARLAYVQTMLQSVQLRKTPTLEELLQESEFNTRSSSSRDTGGGSVLQGFYFSSPPESNATAGVSPPPLTSTTYSACFASDKHPNQPNSLIGVSHQTVSSGYVTYENDPYSSSSVLGRVDESHGFSEGGGGTCAFFLHNTSDTIAKMPDIISYPPIDGDELERSGLESSLGDDHIVDVSGPDLCDHWPEEEGSKNDLVDSIEGEDNLEQNGVNRTEGPAASAENTVDPELPQTGESHHIQQIPTEAEPAHSFVDEPSERPYRMSLQALLKKSQEYRRRQRMLRNQAKNTKAQPRAKTEEQSLSDKENDEFSHKATGTESGKKAKERRDTLYPTVEMSPKKSREDERTIEAEFLERNLKSQSIDVTGAENENEISVKEDITNNKLNVSQDVVVHQATVSETSPATKASYLTSAFHRSARKYHTIPAPKLCKSPVYCKPPDLADTSERRVLVNTAAAEEPCPSTVSLTVEGDVTVRSSQHIDQLVSDLSGLKVLISDLESTLAQNLGDPGQTENNTLNEEHMQPHQSNWEDNPRDDSDQCRRRQSLDGDEKVHEDTDPDDVPPLNEAVNLSELSLVKTLATERAKDKEGQAKSRGGSGKPLAKCLLSVAQRLRVPDIFRNILPETAAATDVSVLSDASNHPPERRTHDSSHLPSLNQSYDVDSPSGLWLLDGSGSDSRSTQEKELTPESGSESQGGASRVKRRLLMHATEERRDGTGGATAVRPSSSTPRPGQKSGGQDGPNDRQEQLRQAHAAQVRALQEEHQRQQQELLQELAVRYHLLQSVSFPCSMSSSRPGDTLTFPTLSQPTSTVPERHRPLLAAAAKGFLTRRLLRTERVAQLVRTVRDTQQLLQVLQQQSPGRAELLSRQDLLLQERVALQLRAARYEVSDIFFSLSVTERMQLISWDRELARERELRQQSGPTGQPRGKSSLSAATQKSLERKRGMMIQKKAAGRLRGAKATGHGGGSSGEQPQHIKRGQLRANPQRVPKSTYSSRPR